MRARVVALSAVLLLPMVAALPAGAGGGGGGLCTTVSKANALTMRDFCFEGIAHVTTVGSTITITNQGQTAHNLIAVDGGFGVKQLDPGERSELRLDRPGVYQYYCTFHGSTAGTGMAGVLVVEDRASLAATRSNAATHTPTAADAASAATTAAEQPGSAWGWVALAAILLAGAALCVSLAVVRPRQT